MRNILFFVIVILCFIQVNESLSNKIGYTNIVFANSADSPQVNIPVIDRNIPTNIETATFAMG
jgi:hypothetical protein